MSGQNTVKENALTDVLKTLLAPATAITDIMNLRRQANALREKSALTLIRPKQATLLMRQFFEPISKHFNKKERSKKNFFFKYLDFI